jgi:hypothetical protein
MNGNITVLGQLITLPMIRKAVPTLVAQQIVGVQPMNLDLGAFFTPYIPNGMRPKYKFSRAKWHEANFDESYFFEVDDWCTEQFGPRVGQPDAWTRWIHKYQGKIHFRDEKDYAWFVLRWS